MTKKHPMQPLEIDPQKVVRFKRNRIVEYLLKHGGIDLNRLARLGFSDEDHMQFAQLIGYSVSGFGDLPYADRRTVRAADRHARKLWEAEGMEHERHGEGVGGGG